MDIYNFIELIGGLCLFLYGMHVLGDSLTTISGGKMEQLLRRLSSTKLKGLLLGTVVTAVIQSSSATTVMVVALVNSGVMKLKQAVPIIMGANIGTTVTGWILSLSGVSGDSFFVQILKPSTFTPILSLFGILLIFTSKIESKKAAGTALLGFAVLMFGMQTMSGSVSPLRSDPNFFEAVKIFNNPIIGVVVGAILTAIFQSSSAMTGVLQALSTTGAISFTAVLPLVMGQNIGTCITAILSSIGAEKNAKRASVVHLSFNVIGTVLFMILFYTIHFFWPFPFMDNTANEVSIAIIHTVFNVFTVVVLFPFSNQLVRISKMIIKDDVVVPQEDELSKELRMLDPRFLERPGFAVEQAYTVINEMMKISETSLREAINLIYDFDIDKYVEVERLENQVDQLEDALMEYTMNITAHTLNPADNRKLTIMMHSLNDIERISDHAINIADQAKRKFQSDTLFSIDALNELKVYTDAILEIMELAKEALSSLDLNTAFDIQPLEDRIDEINKMLSDLHVERLKNGLCNVDNGITLVEIFTCLERIADHCCNMSICIIQFSEQHFRQHDFNARFTKDHPKYLEKYSEYSVKYQIPSSSLAEASNKQVVLES